MYALLWIIYKSLSSTVPKSVSLTFNNHLKGIKNNFLATLVWNITMKRAQAESSVFCFSLDIGLSAPSACIWSNMKNFLEGKLGW